MGFALILEIETLVRIAGLAGFSSVKVEHKPRSRRISKANYNSRLLVVEILPCWIDCRSSQRKRFA